MYSNGNLQQYYLRQNHNRVEAWSIARLTFEPRDWLKDFRKCIRVSISQLRAQPYQVLHAIYGSTIKEPCDVENILLYNVGTSYFNEATRYGLRFERAYQITEACPSPLAGQALHYHDYFLTPTESSFRHWRQGRILARWHFDCSPGNIHSCAHIWYAMKTGQMDAVSDCPSPLQQYGIRLNLSVPVETQVHLVDIVKPFFDGIISASHQHDGTEEPELSQRVARKLGVSACEISKLLQSQTATVLGKRRVLHRHGNSVQWNPQDELCLAGELLMNNVPEQRQCTVSGEMFEIKAFPY